MKGVGFFLGGVCVFLFCFCGCCFMGDGMFLGCCFFLLSVQRFQITTVTMLFCGPGSSFQQLILAVRSPEWRMICFQWQLMIDFYKASVVVVKPQC